VSRCTCTADPLGRQVCDYCLELQDEIARHTVTTRVYYVERDRCIAYEQALRTVAQLNPDRSPGAFSSPNYQLLLHAIDTACRALTHEPSPDGEHLNQSEPAAVLPVQEKPAA
jgi:hypothetical protein